VDRTRLSIGIVLVLVSAVWVAQGLDAGFVPQSAMTGETIWVVLGTLGLVVGLALIWWGRKPNESNDSPDKSG
jgi:hypothetical protein